MNLSHLVINLNYFCVWAGGGGRVSSTSARAECFCTPGVLSMPEGISPWSATPGTHTGDKEHKLMSLTSPTSSARFGDLVEILLFTKCLKAMAPKVKVPSGAYHMWNYLCPHDHFPELLLGHPRKSSITNDAESLKFAGLDFLIIILLPLWEMNYTPSLVFSICRWFWLNCTIDPKMDRKPSSLSPVPEGVKASLDLLNSAGYTGALQSI